MCGGYLESCFFLGDKNEGKLEEKNIQNIVSDLLTCLLNPDDFPLTPLNACQSSSRAIYTVFNKESESEVKKYQILEPGGKN